MKQLVVAAAVVLSFATSAVAQQQAPQIAFDSVPNFLKLPPDLNLGEAAGVAVNSKGHVFVFTRSNSAHGPAFGATAAQLLEFGPDGKFIREVAPNLYAWSFAHSVAIDRDDNIWVVDKGSDMVVKLDPTGHALMVFGRKAEASDEIPHLPLSIQAFARGEPAPEHQNGRFRQPTGVAWDSKGNAYISDGYVNSRVAKIDKNGDWVASWGKRGNKEPGEFLTPHAIAVDAKDNVYVADRGNARIQVFDTDGKFLRQFKIDVPVPPGSPAMFGNAPSPSAPASAMSPGAPDALCITPGPNQVMYAADLYPGRIYKVALDGKVLGVLGRSGRQLGQFGWIHQLACPSENEVYAAELLNWRVQKLLLHPERPQTKSQASPR